MCVLGEEGWGYGGCAYVANDIGRFYSSHPLASNLQRQTTKKWSHIADRGVVTQWSAYVVNFDSGTISLYQSDVHNGRETRKLAGNRKLDPKLISDIRALAEQAIAANYSSPYDTADFSLGLAVSKDGKITGTNTFGPVDDEKQPISALLKLLSGQLSTKASSDTTQ